jgi:hypothetical protein
MKQQIELLIESILALDGVDDVLTLSEAGGIKLLDGRWLVPLNVYLRREEKPETLGVTVKDNITIGDKFGG